MKKIFSFIFMLMCLIGGCSCNKNIQKTTIFSVYAKAYLDKNDQESFYVAPFGAYVSLSGHDKEKIKNLESKFNELVIRYHSLLDRNYYYKDEDGKWINNIKVINDSYGSGNSVVVDSIVIQILKEGIKYTKLSNGKFNIFSGSVVDLWEPRFIVGDDKYSIDPDEEEINEAMKCVVKANEIDSVFVINEENSSITFNRVNGCGNRASITLGALAKSYFLDILVQEPDFNDLNNILIDAGQSSIILKGENPLRSSKEWFIDLKSSLNGQVVLQLKFKGDEAVSTSSIYNKRYVKEDDTIRHHIIDATTGYPSNYLLGVTVSGESAMVMDIVTTTLMTMNIEQIKGYLTNLKNNDINIKVLLQVNEENELKILVNEEMKRIIGDHYCDFLLEDFDYGA